MRHRIGGLENVCMGLGADDIPYELDNSWSENQRLNNVVDEMFDNALEMIFKVRGVPGFDFKVDGDSEKFIIHFGFEPAYQFDPYLMFCITSSYNNSYIQIGKAVGEWAKEIEKEKPKYIIDESCDEDFVLFVDKWFPRIHDTLTERCLHIKK